MFNLRVYGILINDKQEILVSDEYIRGKYYTKFPGGGLELGEGTRECLKREFMEEMNLRVDVGEHLYTTDFYQISAFNPSHQIISIYYYVKALEEIKATIKTKEFDYEPAQMATYQITKEIESFRFIPMSEFSADCVTLPIDKVVANLLLGYC